MDQRCTWYQTSPLLLSAWTNIPGWINWSHVNRWTKIPETSWDSLDSVVLQGPQRIPHSCTRQCCSHRPLRGGGWAKQSWTVLAHISWRRYCSDSCWQGYLWACSWRATALLVSPSSSSVDTALSQHHLQGWSQEHSVGIKGPHELQGWKCARTFNDWSALINRRFYQKIF